MSPISFQAIWLVGLAFSGHGGDRPAHWLRLPIRPAGWTRGALLLDGTVKYVEEGTAAGSFLVSFQLCDRMGLYCRPSLSSTLAPMDPRLCRF